MVNSTTRTNKLIRIGMILTLAATLFLSDVVGLFSSFVPASTNEGNHSFFGSVFDAPRSAQVRITSGNVAPAPDDDGRYDSVVMDEFIYLEP
jgi:hypothetical protein